MTLQEQLKLEQEYNELLKYRKEQPSNVIKVKTDKARDYFKNLATISNLEKNIIKGFKLFYAPTIKIRKKNMFCYTFMNRPNEIYIDEDYALNNPRITNIQITHEVLHGLSESSNGYQNFFGHIYQGDNLYIGINEATTQLFTEDIEQQRLGENEDYLYFVKNIMRVMKVILGADKLANQYLNNNNEFEHEFDKLTNGKFKDFASIINVIYSLDKEAFYLRQENKKLNEREIERLSLVKEQIINFTKNFIERISKTRPQIIQELSTEIRDENFLSKIGIKTNKIEYVYYLHGTANQSPEVVEDFFNNGLVLEGDTALRLHSTLAPISEETIKTRNLGDIMHEYSQLEDFNSVFLIKIPKEYLSCKPHRDGSVDIPMPLWKNIGNGNSVLTPHLIQGVYNRHIDRGISNPNFCPLYNPNGMAYSMEQFYSFSGYDRTDLMSEYKQRQLTSFAQQYASDSSRGTFNQAIRYYQNKFGQLPQPQLFDSSEYRMLLEQALGQGSATNKPRK